MNIAKYSPFFILALCIDGFQFLISLALSVITLMPGTIGGCAFGAYYAGEVGCAVLGLIGSIPVVNGVLALAAAPIGMALGFAISICISFTLGAMLILFLLLAGFLDKKAVLFCFTMEVLPGFSMLPAWTGFVMRCAYVNEKEKLVGGIVGGVTVVASGLVLPNSPIGNAMRQGTLVGSGGLARDIPRKEPQDAAYTTTQRTPMQDVRIKPATNPTYAKAA